jgi:hypothetical protein
MDAVNNNYDFTSSSTQAFGNNMILVDGYYFLMSGDVNQDEVINNDDFNRVKQSAALFLTGYFPEDLTGDLFIETADFSLIEDNLLKIISRP